MDERWMPAYGFAGRYEVSNLGRVRSVPRAVVRNGRVRNYPGRILKPFRHHAHYKVSLYGDNKRGREVFVHRIVLESFVGPMPAWATLVRHLDDNSLNNRLDNLKYGTHTQNAHDAVRNGVHPETRRTHCKYGHPLDGMTRKGRYCKTCAIAKQRRLKAQKKLRARQSPDSVPKKKEQGK